jgi:MFS family permease
MQYYLVLRRNPQFARLWAAMLISFVGDWFNTIVLAAIVSRFTEGSGLAIGGFLLARFLPPLLVTPLAGALADRFDRKKLLIYSDALRVFIVLGYLLVRTPDQLWLLYVLTILQFCLGAVFEPTRAAFTPSIVPQADLVTANVLSSITWSVALALGGALGGFVAGAFGPQIALTVDALSFGVSALLILQIRPIYAVENAAERQHFSLRDISEGLRYAKAHPATAATLLVKFGGSLGNVDTIMVVYGTVLFSIGENGSTSLGILYTAFGVGAIFGLIAIERFNDGVPRTMRRLIALGYALITCGWLLLGSSATIWVASLALIIKAMGSNAYWTYSSVILQKTVDDRYLGRMFSLDFAGFQLSTVLSTIVTSTLLQVFGNAQAPAVVIGTGVVSLLPLALWSLALPWIARQEASESPVTATAPGD